MLATGNSHGLKKNLENDFTDKYGVETFLGLAISDLYTSLIYGLTTIILLFNCTSLRRRNYYVQLIRRLLT